MAIKRYRGKITKGKRKGKQGFITQREWIKQNVDSITFDAAELNESETKELKRLQKNLKISLKAKQRIRIKGKFLNKEQNKYIKKTLKERGKDFNQKNVDELLTDELFFTFQSLHITDLINNHKGGIQINGIDFNKSEAINEFDTLNRENYREWADTLKIKISDIWFIIYDAYYIPLTKVLNIDTMVNDQSRVIFNSKPQDANETTKK